MVQQKRAHVVVDRKEESLARARAAIRRASSGKMTVVNNSTSHYQEDRFVPSGPVYRNPRAFHQLRFLHSLSVSLSLVDFFMERGQMDASSCSYSLISTHHFSNQRLKNKRKNCSERPITTIFIWISRKVLSVIKLS